MISSTSLFIESRLTYIVENVHLKRCLLIFNPCPILAYLALHAEIQSKNRGVVKANPGKYQWKFENLDLEQ